jgi:diphthamide biosynthesis methyltransferase
MSTTAQYASTPKVGSALLTTADTSLTAPTTVGTVFTAGSSGSRIDYIEVMGVATTVAGLINLFIYDGSTYSLWQQIPVLAVTTSTTAASFTAVISSNSNANVMPLTIPTGYSLRATTTVAQTGVRVIAYGGDF